MKGNYIYIYPLTLDTGELLFFFSFGLGRAGCQSRRNCHFTLVRLRVCGMCNAAMRVNYGKTVRALVDALLLFFFSSFEVILRVEMWVNGGSIMFWTFL